MGAFFMKSAAQTAYEKVKKSLLMAPGMVEESERRLLFKAAFNCRLPVVEFGAFFGASTLALAHGLSASETKPFPLTCIDAFEVRTDHSFHKHVISYARRCKAEKLLRTDGERTNWLEITKAVLGNKIENVRLIKGIVNNNFDMTLLPETIGLLHLDLPKDAKTIQPILKGAFPKLSKGSIIAFQDYAYQFSNELISLFELLEQLGYIKAVNIAASSMFFEVQNDYSLSPENLDSILQKAVDNQTNLIQNAIQKYKNYQTSRPQEIIALYSAAIRATTTEKKSSKFQQQHHIRTLIKQIFAIDGERAAFTLAELLTETLETHT
jgi:hypothetical protein